MRRVPQRVLLSSETAGVVREQILAGEWSESLPGERELCDRLRISRPTLRAALETLRQEGLLEVAQGKRRRILQIPSPTPTPNPPSNRVALLTPVPLHRMPPLVVFWVDDLRERLAEEGMELDLRTSHVAELARPERLLERLVAEHQAAAWILFVSTEPMQRWFAARGLPCIVTGSRFAGVDLPSVDVDYQAACRHAAGVFLGKGHRRLALLLPDGGTAGDQASEAGFLEGCHAIHGGVTGAVVRHDESVTDVCRKLDRLLASNHRITALLVARSAHTLTVITHLQRQGIRLPEDVSLISRDDDSFLDYVLPRPSRYACNPTTFARRVSGIVLQLAKAGTAPAKQYLMMPEFIKGDTVG